jgi:hypothetical protein
VVGVTKATTKSLTSGLGRGDRSGIRGLVGSVRNKLTDKIDPGGKIGLRNKLNKINTGGIVDRVKNRLGLDEKTTKIGLANTLKDKIEKAEELKINEREVEENLEETLLAEIQKQIDEEGQKLYDERNDEDGIFADIIQVIEESLEAGRYVSNVEVKVDSALEPEGDDDDDTDADEEVKDPIYYLLETTEENNNLYTHGKQLYTLEGNSYSGPFHTRNVDGELRAYPGPKPNNDVDVEEDELIVTRNPEEVELLDVDLDPKKLEVKVEHKDISDYWTSDAEISVEVTDDDTTGPNEVRWLRTDDKGNSEELKFFENKLTADQLPYGVYTIAIQDSTVDEYTYDIREDYLPEDAAPDENSMRRLFRNLLQRRDIENLNTNGYEFYLGGLPYEGSYHIVEIDMDPPPPEPEPLPPTPPPVVKNVKDRILENINSFIPGLIGVPPKPTTRREERQAKRDQRREEKKDRREQKKQDRQDRRDARKDARQDRRDDRKEAKQNRQEARQDRRDERKNKRDDRKQKRSNRRENRRNKRKRR